MPTWLLHIYWVWFYFSNVNFLQLSIRPFFNPAEILSVMLVPLGVFFGGGWAPRTYQSHKMELVINGLKDIFWAPAIGTFEIHKSYPSFYEPSLSIGPYHHCSTMYYEWRIVKICEDIGTMGTYLGTYRFFSSRLSQGKVWCFLSQGNAHVVNQGELNRLRGQDVKGPEKTWMDRNCGSMGQWNRRMFESKKRSNFIKIYGFEVRTWTNYCKWTLPIFGRPAMPQRFSWRSNHWPLQTQTAFDSWRLYSLYTSKIGESQRSCSWQGPHIRFIGETGLEDPKWWPVDLVFGLATHTFVFERSWLPLAHSISKYWMSFQPWCNSFRTWEVAFERRVRSIHQHMGVVLKPMQDF